jgi:hypothetical protein
MTELLPHEPTVVPPASAVGQTVPCVYCREPIAASAFAYWSGAKRLLSAACPTCQRRVTLTAAIWWSWSGESDASAATT